MHRVLLILDSEDLSAVLHKKLSENFEVEICDAATAVDTIEHYQPDALILDLFLSGTDGFQILQRIGHNIPTILLTVLLSSDIIDRAIDLNIDYIFLKPFKLSALTTQLYKSLCVDDK